MADIVGIKGMVLAAGFGTRLKPFTDLNPKPLFPFFGISLLELGLFRLREAGITNISANAHHHFHKIEEALKKSPLGRDIRLSIELPDILGRGGAFVPLKSWRSGADLLVYNGDIASDVDVAALCNVHRKNKNIATMLLLPKPLSRDAAVYRIADRVVAISKTPPEIPGATAHGFACLHILTDAFLNLLPQSGTSDVLEAYQQAFTRGLPVGCAVHHGFWHGIETPQNAWDAHMDLMKLGFDSEKTGIREVYKYRNEKFTFSGSVFVGPRCVLAEDADIGPNVILSGDHTIGAGTQIKNALLLQGVNVAAGEKIENAVVGFDGSGQRVIVNIVT